MSARSQKIQVLLFICQLFHLYHGTSAAISLEEFLKDNSEGNSIVHSRFFDGKGVGLGSNCSADAQCAHILHAECKDSQCACAVEYYRDNASGEVCIAASDWGEVCNAQSAPCKEHLMCEDGRCICKNGFVRHADQCMRKCPKGEIAVAEWDHKCAKLRKLGEECAYHEQCHVPFSQCVQGKCGCRIGTTNLSDQVCVAQPQCPLGPAPMINNSVISCSIEKQSDCSDGFHCQPFNYGRTKGFCCPVSAPRCPVGVPHQHSDCASCPYDTHNCYTFNVGSKQHSLCCPNECHRSAPVRHEGKCLPLVPPGGECHTEAQCSGLLSGASCVEGVCKCPKDTLPKNGKCVELSPWNGECSSDMDCMPESQLRCMEGRCKCGPEHIPDPDSDAPKYCIPAATCPTASGLFKKVSTFSPCDAKNQCADNEFCRKWWNDEASEKNFSLCCPKPGVHDYTTICGRFGMSLVLTNSIDAIARPLPCGLTPMEDSNECPDGAACVFNPFSEGIGICCRAINNHSIL